MTRGPALSVAAGPFLALRTLRSASVGSSI
jgi:hypothetical protein